MPKTGKVTGKIGDIQRLSSKFSDQTVFNTWSNQKTITYDGSKKLNSITWKLANFSETGGVCFIKAKISIKPRIFLEQESHALAILLGGISKFRAQILPWNSTLVHTLIEYDKKNSIWCINLWKHLSKIKIWYLCCEQR